MSPVEVIAMAIALAVWTFLAVVAFFLVRHIVRSRRGARS